MVGLLAKKFDVLINKKWCKGCGLCIGICPKKVLELDDRVKCEAVRTDDCIGCRQCENVCPDFAVTVKEREENA
jgi:2-oxoglutarate ferredoxin oxidoreductase subunit delta